MSASIPVVSASGGPLLIPAHELTDLLRRVAAGWLQSEEAGDTDLDARTMRALAGVLCELADQIDVECIGFMPIGGEGEGEGGGVGRGPGGGSRPG
ncbi:DUF6213 family protein [Streptomyces bambusae]|uniref:DUF6213 family protein n=1 Tax=Streptomyces bambusae TaxID=1550616 RepID=UPI001C724D07|nr:DUF6213 family protein [Streptomyces bambusae]